MNLLNIETSIENIVLLIIYILAYVSIHSLFAFVPWHVAKRKGYHPGAWWFYGFFFFVIAIIHIALLPDKNKKESPPQQQPTGMWSGNIADEIGKYKDLLDRGAITEEEYERQKNWILNANGRP